MSLKEMLKSIHTKMEFIRACQNHPEIIDAIIDGVWDDECHDEYRTEWADMSSPGISLWDRLCCLKYVDSLPLEMRAWNLYYIVMTGFESKKMAKWLNELLDSFMENHLDQLPEELVYRIYAAKSCAMKFPYMFNPFQFSKTALEITQTARTFDFDTIDPMVSLQLRFNESCYLLNQNGSEFTDNIEQSIKLSEDLFSELTLQNWDGIQIMIRDIHNHLGTAYGRRAAGNTADNIEMSILHHTKALELSQQEDPPSNTAPMLNNLGLAYRRRIKGDKAENIETSIDYLNRALEQHLAGGNDLYIAQTLTNLGVSYCDRLMGTREDNLYRATAFYRRALGFMDPVKHAGFRSWTLHNLGVAYHFLPPGRGGTNREKAITCYRRALEFRTRESRPMEWLLTSRNLSKAYSSRKKGNPAKNSDTALGLLDGSLTAIPRETHRMEWAHTRSTYGTVWARRNTGDTTKNLETAADHFQAALEIFKPEMTPVETREAALWLGRVYIRLGQYEDAEHSLRIAALADRYRYRQMFMSQSRSIEIETGSEVYYLMANALARQQKNMEALEWLEKGKTRMLVEQLQLDQAAFDRLPEDLRDEYINLITRLQALRIEHYIPARDLKLIIDETWDTQSRLDQLLADVRQDHPDFLSDTRHFRDSLTGLSTDSCIIEYDVTDNGTAIFLITRGHDGPVVEVVFNESFNRDDLQRFMKNWISRLRRVPPVSTPEDREAWGEYALHRLRWLSTRLVKPIDQAIRDSGITHILFVPHLSLHLLPLHLMTVMRAGIRRLLIEEYPVSYLPSLSIGSLSKRKSGGPPKEHFVGISNPTLDLRGADREIERIQTLFDSRKSLILKGKSANREDVASAVQSAGFIHFACHARFNLSEPYKSYLALASPSTDSTESLSQSRLITHTVKSDPLYLSDIYSCLNLDGYPLVVLSCCESGLTTGSENSDEFIGFAAGFLRSGARAVLSSLWVVDDQATVDLMESFYKNIINSSLTSSEALRQAQLAMRQNPVFSNPFYWAAFKIHGN